MWHHVGKGSDLRPCNGPFQLRHRHLCVLPEAYRHLVNIYVFQLVLNRASDKEIAGAVSKILTKARGASGGSDSESECY